MTFFRAIYIRWLMRAAAFDAMCHERQAPEQARIDRGVARAHAVELIRLGFGHWAF